jgi:hypothetical protein
MEAQFNFQLRHRNDKRKWEEIEVITKPIATEPQQYAMQKTFQNIPFGSPIDRGKRTAENKRNIHLRTNRTFKN